MDLKNAIVFIWYYFWVSYSNIFDNLILVDATHIKNHNPAFIDIDKGTSIDKPYFDEVNTRNVTTNIDGIAILKCRVKNKGNRTVSWIRTKDLHVISANQLIYSGDQRFSVLQSPELDEWNLKIEYVQQRDSGFYECQVNTEPKLNYLIYLHVTETLCVFFFGSQAAALAKISGSQEVHVKIYSTISLSCSVNVQTSSIYWYHGSKIVNFNSTRGGISLETEKTDFSTTSRLLVTRATASDSGNYSCVPKDQAWQPASVLVHVINGEQPAAMQTSFALKPSCNLTLLLFSTIATLLYATQVSIFTSKFISLKKIKPTITWCAKEVEIVLINFLKYLNYSNYRLSKIIFESNQMFLVNCVNVNKKFASR